MIKKSLFALILVTGLSALLFFSGEVLVRVLYSRFSNYNLEMWRYAAELKQALPYKNLPFHHFPDKSGYFYGVTIKTNSAGFRDREFSREKLKNITRIIFLGDSFTLGWGVPIEETYSKRLEQKLNKFEKKYEVINMGIGNYNSIMEVELFKSKGLEFDPDIVVLMYFINDAEPTPSSVPILEQAVRRHSYFFAFVHDRYLRFKAVFSPGSDWKSYYSDLYLKNSENLNANRAALEELIKICHDNNIRLLIVNINELHKLKEYPFQFATDYVRNIAEEGNVPFLDLLQTVIGHEPESLWVTREDSHANAMANEIIAQAIFKKLLEDNLIE